MKYFIRTPHTIFEVIGENDKVFFVKAKNKKNTYSKSKCQTVVLQKADTIEELCDEFVDIYKYEKPDIALLKDIKFFESYKNHTVYGAIWTDKGLIYVAKMNEEGKLELL